MQILTPTSLQDSMCFTMGTPSQKMRAGVKGAGMFVPKTNQIKTERPNSIFNNTKSNLVKMILGMEGDDNIAGGLEALMPETSGKSR